MQFIGAYSRRLFSPRPFDHPHGIDLRYCLSAGNGAQLVLVLRLDISNSCVRSYAGSGLSMLGDNTNSIGVNLKTIQFIFFLIAITITLGSARPTIAGSASAPLSITATVMRACRLSQ